VDTGALVERLKADIARIESGNLTPGPEAPLDPLTV
jgi:hypothetical protein